MGLSTTRRHSVLGQLPKPLMLPSTNDKETPRPSSMLPRLLDPGSTRTSRIIRRRAPTPTERGWATRTSSADPAGSEPRVDNVLPRAARSAKIHSVPIRDQTRPESHVMRSRLSGTFQRALRSGSLAALLLAIGVLGDTAPGQDGGKPPQAKDQTKPNQSDDAAPKQGDSKPAPVKLGLSINDPKALQGYTLISPFDSTKTFL